jgi:hypothetical protein
MFWGCFSGLNNKKPGIFWEKDWGSINKISYYQHTVPIIYSWIRMHPEQLLIQDNTPGYIVQYTRKV